MKRKGKSKKRVKPTASHQILTIAQREALQEAWKHGQLVLFLGAGVSLDYGLPAWRNLVLELLFEEVADDSRLRQIAINYRRAVSDWLADYFDYSPIVLARLIEDYVVGAATSGTLGDRLAARSRFLRRLQETIYADVTQPVNRTALQAVAGIVATHPPSSLSTSTIC
jgi:hypothetical protein